MKNFHFLTFKGGSFASDNPLSLAIPLLVTINEKFEVKCLKYKAECIIELSSSFCHQQVGVFVKKP